VNNPYCEALGIAVPRLESAKDSPDANYFALLIVALLERGAPMTLEQVARRFEQAGIAAAPLALASLKRCKPGRPPIYREGERYSLDPHDDETDLWAFRLGLRPARAVPVAVVRPEPGPLPTPEAPLSPAQLEELLRDPAIGPWSAQRVAICVLDAHGGTMTPRGAVDFVAARAGPRLSEESARYWRAGSAIRVGEDGSWSLETGHPAVRSARQAARDRLAVTRRWAHSRPDPVVQQAVRRRLEREREAHADRLARMTRVIVHAFPPSRPAVVALVDVGRRGLETLAGDEVARAREIIAKYDVIAALDARAQLRALGLDPAGYRLDELGPPQKSYQLNREGRTLRITTALLIQGTCGLSRPLGDPKALMGYLQEGSRARLRRRLEADAKALCALYQYGRLHGGVRLRWGFVDEMLPVPWKHRDEPGLHGLMRRAHESQVPLEVVTGNAPGWAEPWARAERAVVRMAADGWRTWLLGERGAIDSEEVQLARLADDARSTPGAP
jgi:hypothetical protein